MHYLRIGAALGLSPNPAFDEAFYRSQHADRLPPDITPLEHYLHHGAHAALDTSPLFSPRGYLRIHADVADLNLDPLWHFVRWGMGEGRQALPDDLPDQEARIEQVLAREPENALAWRMLGELRLRQHRPQEALDALDRAGRGRTLDPPGRLFRSHAMLQLGMVDQAIPILTRLVTEAPGLRGALPVELLYEAGQREWAISMLEAAEPVQEGHRKVIEAGLSSVKAICLEEGFRYEELLPERPIDPIKLRFAAELPRPTALPGRLVAPALYLAVVESCIALPRCNLLMRGDRLIYDLAADELGGMAMLGDQFGDRRIIRGRSGRRVLLDWPTDAPQEQDAGLMMFGRQTRNYGHWCLEFLPRMLVFDRKEWDESWPILVDAGMPSTHLEALKLLNTCGRRTIEIPDDRPLQVRYLGVAPVPAFFPCDTVPGHFYDAIWPADVLAALSRRVLEQLGLPTDAWAGSVGRRLFVGRKGFSQRRMINEAEIAAFLDRYGFEMVSPEEHSFEEQVRLFHSASLIVGSCSSGLTSALFCRPGTRLVGLIHSQPEFNYGGYASFLRAAGAEIEFVRGETSFESNQHPYHRSFRIEPGQILEPLRRVEQRA